MTVKDLINAVDAGTVCERHTAWARGYVSRKSNSDGEYGYVKPYSGRYGKGYVYITPSWKTSRFYHKTYFLFVEQ